MKDEYKKIIEVYEKMGNKYLKNIKSLTPTEFYDFVKLLQPKSKILDVGCAGGRDSKRFRQRNFNVFGIDLVDSFLKEARKNVFGVKFIKMDMRKLEFPENYFDAIWANAVLLHLKKKDVPKTLREFHRVLRPGGKLQIRVKQGQGQGYEKDELSGGEKRFFTYFSKDEAEKFVRNADFEIINSGNITDESGRKGVMWISILAEKT